MRPAPSTILIKRLSLPIVLLLAVLATGPCAALDQRDEFIRVSPDGWHFETAKTHKPFIPFGGVYFDPATYVDKPFPRFLVIERVRRAEDRPALRPDSRDRGEPGPHLHFRQDILARIQEDRRRGFRQTGPDHRPREEARPARGPGPIRRMGRLPGLASLGAGRVCR